MAWEKYFLNNAQFLSTLTYSSFLILLIYSIKRSIDYLIEQNKILPEQISNIAIFSIIPFIFVYISDKYYSVSLYLSYIPGQGYIKLLFFIILCIVMIGSVNFFNLGKKWRKK